MLRKFVAVLICVLVLGTGKSQGSIFFDNFNGEHGGVGILNYTGFSNWAVSGGSVDLIGAGTQWDLQPGHGLYVDMDGSTKNAGKMMTSVPITLSPGTYELSYLLAGNHRTASSETVYVQVNLGTLVNETRSLAQNADFQSFSNFFTVSSTTNVQLSFEGSPLGNLTSDNVGMLLDDVRLERVTSYGSFNVPEPATFAIWSLLGGLGICVGWMRKRRAA